MSKYFLSRFKLYLFLACCLICSSYTIPDKVPVSKFGALPNDGQNDAAQLRQAISYCKTHPGITLYFPPGVYDFSDEKAVQLMQDVAAGRLGKNPQKTIFTPYYPYVKGLDFKGLQNIVIEAEGATLLCDGWLEPISLNNCKNIRLKGITIDYKHKPYSIGKIVEVQPTYFDALYEDIYPVDTNVTMLRITIYDVKARRYLNTEFVPPHKIIGPHKLRFFRKIDPLMLGNLLRSPRSFHFRPAILIQEAENIKLEDVTIHAQPGMGIVGHRSKNITLTGVKVVPPAGGIQSSNTDATHFTSCIGLLRYENCQFEGQGDDGINVHNYYYGLQKSQNSSAYNLNTKGAELHAQVLDYPDVKDTLELVNRSTLAVVKKVVVKTRVNNIDSLYTTVTLNEKLPADIDNYYLINITRLPRVEIIGCNFINNRARGILIKTRNVLIERCLIKETSGTGIHIGAESNWLEGPTSANVIIRNNRIIRCGGGAGTIERTSGIAVNVIAPDKTLAGLHKHITIEGNIIEGDHAENGIYISGATDVTIRSNEISGCTKPINIKYADDVKVYANPGVPDVIQKTVR
ncbi:right-handed parallel beta-helix repeat-containing protein [Mucilaginibacter sp. UYCu711]|uniref:right-handed parallel beta-helix repeat-containing protein n=1 Tax=Mucilaginibacter sp. UYCu711 TaxID=3156339 RepID=UPI003D26058A